MALIVYKENPACGKQMGHEGDISYYRFEVSVVNSLGTGTYIVC
jgi:hypothetical protein